MANKLFVPGGGLDFGEEVQLNEASLARTEMAAAIYEAAAYPGFFDRASKDSKIFVIGGHPSLPAGLHPEDFNEREGQLMADRLLLGGVPHQKIEVDVSSLSTVANVDRLFTLMTGIEDYDIDDIDDHVNPDSLLGIISRKGHIDRFVQIMRAAGCNKELVQRIPVEEGGGGLYDKLTVGISALMCAGVRKKEVPASEKLAKLGVRNRPLEIVNDARVRAGSLLAKR